MSTFASALPGTNNLALSFQDVITVILRTRYRVQRVTDTDSFRANVQRMISAAVNEARGMGYTNETAQMALYAIIGFLDESVLSSNDPVFANWARQPMQELMFGNHNAGEFFFRNVNELLNRPDSAELADNLELHAVCMMLGYQGRFAMGNASEIQDILRRIREKIARVRGPLSLLQTPEAPVVEAKSTRDAWVKRLLLLALIAAVVAVCAFAGYKLLLLNGAHIAMMTVHSMAEVA